MTKPLRKYVKDPECPTCLCQLMEDGRCPNSCNTSPTLVKLIELAEQKRAQTGWARLRLGQAYSYALWKLDTRLSYKLLEQGLDPFYDDARLGAWLIEVGKAWEQR